MYSKILLPTDGSENAIRAAEHAAALAEKFGAQTTIATAVYVPPMYSSDIVGVEDAFLTEATRMIESTKKVFSTKNLECATKLLRWVHPVEGICNEAREGEYDLVVMGRTGRADKPGNVLGSVSDGVLREAPCAVLIVR
jgi:nucleotide-binding universal stress UspA family protein